MANQKNDPAVSGFQPIEVEAYVDETFKPIEVTPYLAPGEALVAKKPVKRQRKPAAPKTPKAAPAVAESPDAGENKEN